MKVKLFQKKYLYPLSLIALGVIIGIVITFFTFDVIGIYCGTRKIDFGLFWTALSSIGTIGALLWAVQSYNNSVNVQRKQKTIDSFPAFREKYIDIDKSIEEYNRRGCVTGHLEDIENYLDALEHFAVGVNEDMFDINIIKKMSATMVLDQQAKLQSAMGKIKEKYADKGIDTEQFYCEYEKMCENIKHLIAKEQKSKGEK